MKKTPPPPTIVCDEPFLFELEVTNLTLGVASTSVRGSALISDWEISAFNKRLLHKEGKIVSDWDILSGGGENVGTFDGKTLSLDHWESGADNKLRFTAAAVEVKTTPCTKTAFHLENTPVAPASFSFLCSSWINPNVVEILGQSNEDGIIYTTIYGVFVPIGVIEYQTGVILLDFSLIGRNEDAISALPHNIPMEWFVSVDLASLTYQYVSYESLPIEEAIIGVDTTRMPSDGKVPIFRQGNLVFIHHTGTIEAPSLSPTQVIDCERERLYRVAIRDVNCKQFTDDMYAVDPLLGTVTMAADLDLTSYTAPYSIEHMIGDLRMVTNVNQGGRIGLNAPITHEYPAHTSYASSVLFTGTLQARYESLFMQGAWTDVWQNTRIGVAPLPQYDDITYPIEVTNVGAYTDRILIRFTDTTEFQCFGERLGHIGNGNTSTKFEPRRTPGDVYPLFTLHYQGWGAGISTGNCLRFNLIAAAYPINLIRAIQPSSPTDSQENVQLLLLGNVDNNG